MSDYDTTTDKDKAYRDEQVLRDMYHGDGLNQAKMAAEFGVGQSTVAYWMDKHGIERRGNAERQVGHPRLNDAEWLRGRYHGDEMTITEISNQLDVARMSVWRALDRHGIERRSKSESQRKTRPHYFTKKDGYELAISSQEKVDGREIFASARIHRLIAVAEWGFDAVAGMEVHHKNGIPWDNRPGNLQLMTKEDHALHHFEDRGGLQPWQRNDSDA